MTTPAIRSTSAPHALDADYVRDQLVARTVDVNGKTYHPEGEYVLYWMQSSHRLDENWALRAAIRTADRVNRPLVIHQGLDPSYPFAADRHHTFVLQGARDTARDAESRGLYYQFVLRPSRNDDRRVVDRLAARAYLVITDLFPTAGIRERVERFADRVSCRVLAIDSVCTVPSGAFEKAEYAARTIRPKIAKLLDHSIEPVADALPRVPASDGLRRSLRATVGEGGLSLLPIATMSDADIAAAVAACHDVDTAAAVQRWFCTERFRVYASTDCIGVEVGGAVKNVLAVAAGISDGLSFGDNTKAALLTRGLVEMARLGVAMGASKDTFYGLSGVGDLLATAGSRLSRNWRVGYALAQGMPLTDAVASIGQVAEGVESSKALRNLSKQLGVEMPVCDAVFAVCYENVQPREAVARLMGRFAGIE